METETRQIHNFRKGDRFHEHYRLLEHVGSGGFADVWKAKDELVDTIVALKIYTRLDKEGISELAKEYKQMKGVKHPNLLTGNHFDASGNIPYLEMDYCDGGSLVRKVGKFSNDELRHVAQDIAKGLAYLHSEGIVHQDIKPENILYDTAHKRYLLSDFGISSKSRTRLSKSVNKANMTLSMTEAYAPPEKFSGNMSGIAPDTKGDIFSLGMTLFELAVGKLPFDPPMATGREMFYSQGRLQLDYSKIQDLQIRKIVEACTRYRKEDRPTSEKLVSMLNESRKEPEKKNMGGKKPTEKINLSSWNNEADAPRKPTEPINKSSVGEQPARVMPDTSLVQPRFGEQRNTPTPPQPINRKWIYILSGVVVIAILMIMIQHRKNPTADDTLLDTSGVLVKDVVQNRIPENFVLCPKGTLLHYKDWDRKKHEDIYVDVPLDSFYISKYELTQKEWNEIMPEITCDVFSFFWATIEDTTSRKKLSGDLLPASTGFVYACYYCNVRSKSEGYSGFYYTENNRLLFNPNGNGYRLPNEYEWVYAARGSERKHTKHAAGDNLSEIAWYGSNSGGIPHNIGEKKPNIIGLFDMNGNVTEWAWPIINDKKYPLTSKGGDYWLFNYNSCFSEDRGHGGGETNGIRLVFVPKNMKNNNIQIQKIEYFEVGNNLAKLFR